MARYISCFGRKIAEEAKRWVGYLEHQDSAFLGLKDVNVGKGGYTVFADHVRREGKRNLQGVPWCAVFVYSVVLRVLGRKATRKLLGRPHARARNLMWAMRLRGLYKPYFRDARVGDIVFLANDGVHIDHCGIIAEIHGIEKFTSIEGNARDESGHFERDYGGSVATRQRHCCDSQVMGYGVITRRYPDGDLN